MKISKTEPLWYNFLFLSKSKLPNFVAVISIGIVEIHLSDWRFCKKPFEEDDVSLFHGSFSLCAITYKKRHKLPNKGNKGFLKGLCWNRPGTIQYGAEWTFIEMLHCKEDTIEVFPEMKLRVHVPNFYINVSVSDLYIPTICPPNLMQQNRRTDCWTICINRSQRHECMYRNWERGLAVSYLGIFVSKFWYSRK